MTDNEFEAQKARIQALTERWFKPIGLGQWRLVVEYVRDSGEYKVDGHASPNGCANMSADWRYLHATVTFNMPVVAEQDDDQLELIYVHELMHIFLNEGRDLVGDGKQNEVRDDWLNHEERMASQLANAFIWIRDASKP